MKDKKIWKDKHRFENVDYPWERKVVNLFSRRKETVVQKGHRFKSNCKANKKENGALPQKTKKQTNIV